MQGLHLTGPILVDDATVADEAWVVSGSITFVRPADANGWPTLDGWVTPGLVDVHCHIGLDSGGAVDDALATKQAYAARDAGTLLIRDAGSPSNTAFLHDDPNAPRLIRSGRFIARPKRYFPNYAREIEVADLPRVAAEEARAGDGWIKLIGDWIDRDVGDLTPLWPADVLAEAVAAAHAEGARVTVHTFATESIDALLDAGVDCIEHGTGMTRAQMRRAAGQRVAVTPTLLQIANFAGFAAQGEAKFPRYAARMSAMYANRQEQARAFVDEGMQILVGTDAGGTIAHGVIADECAALVAAGIPSADVVAAATWAARDYLGVAGLHEGARADLVVFEADPRTDIATLARPRHVVLRGRQQ